MSILISSKNVFLSTQASGGLSGGIDDQLNSFRASLNNVPLQTNNGEYGKLTLTDFTMYRNFYYVNSTNNKFFFQYKAAGMLQPRDSSFNVTPGDYTMADLATQFTTDLIAAMNATSEMSNVSLKLGSSVLPSEADKSGTGKGILKFSLATTGAAISLFKIQARNYDGGTTEASSGNTQGSFNDSYQLFGAKRIAVEDTNFTNESFKVEISGEEPVVLDITGFYPLQMSTTPNLYIRCQEVVDNLESENFKMGQNGGSDTHIVGSTILGKVNVSDEIIRYSGDTSSPYFIMSDNRNISELFFRITDSHGRSVPPVAAEQSTKGNLFVEMTINFSVYTKGTGQPVNNNIENNGNRNAMIIRGGIN